jgi:hypothetical protein
MTESADRETLAFRLGLCEDTEPLLENTMEKILEKCMWQDYVPLVA